MTRTAAQGSCTRSTRYITTWGGGGSTRHTDRAFNFKHVLAVRSCKCCKVQDTGPDDHAFGC
jgi:hypothetical protein